MKTQQAIDCFGSRGELASRLGIDITATYHWGETVPELRQYQIQVLTCGKLIASVPVRPPAKQAA
ncbi:Cro/CI family transcriptional regulator [Propionivibrio sp.]|uniref:Cro/CI family transcriptional regulator n=1 Tax=Propionivibrio sp. TaxID=2212460 RepID=UPI003BF2B0D0